MATDRNERPGQGGTAAQTSQTDVVDGQSSTPASMGPEEVKQAAREQAVVREVIAKEAMEGVSLIAENVNAWYGTTHAIKDVSMSFRANEVTALIGPSGCGKSTFLRCLNRMHEVLPGARVEGSIMIEGQDIYGKGVDPVRVRRHIGMVFQKPNPFPMMTIYDNVIAGLKLNGIRKNRREMDETVERSLLGAALWNEVKDKLKESGASLSGGQQQRLCIARTIAIEPEVVLMDEPCSALDPISTYKIEELIGELKQKYTIAIVTHNMQQASRVADWTAFMLAGDKRYGEMVEYGRTEQIFTHPNDKRTEDYITGRFG
jgi:phosphate transport system ATP-binding protein